MNMPEFCPERLDPGVVKDVTQDTGIQFSVHSPDELDLGSFHNSIREGHLDRCRQEIHWMAQAGAKVFNLHMSPGIYFTLPDRRVWVYGQYVDRLTSNLWRSYSDLISLAKVSNIEVCTENVTNFDLPFIAQAIDELCFMDSFFLTWDIGHDARTGWKEKEVFLRHQDRIRHMHMHDYNGTSDHQVPTTGKIDIPWMLDFAKKNGIRVLLETKTVESVRESVKVINRLM